MNGEIISPGIVLYVYMYKGMVLGKFNNECVLEFNWTKLFSLPIVQSVHKAQDQISCAKCSGTIFLMVSCCSDMYNSTTYIMIRYKLRWTAT